MRIAKWFPLSAVIREGGRIKMIQLDTDIMEAGLIPLTHSTISFLRRCGTRTSIATYVERYGGLNAAWIPKGPVSDDDHILGNDITHSLTLGLPMRVIIIAHDGKMPSSEAYLRTKYCRTRHTTKWPVAIRKQRIGGVVQRFLWQPEDKPL